MGPDPDGLGACLVRDRAEGGRGRRPDHLRRVGAVGLAVRLADRLGVTLIGFLRGDGFNVYSHDGRVDLRDLMGIR